MDGSKGDGSESFADEYCCSSLAGRCTTSCLLCFLTTAYPRCAILFQGLITLDFSSHYIHMYSSLITGSTSHKLVTSDVSWILWYYYNDSVSARDSAGNSPRLLC